MTKREKLMALSVVLCAALLMIACSGPAEPEAVQDAFIPAASDSRSAETDALDTVETVPETQSGDSGQAYPAPGAESDGDGYPAPASAAAGGPVSFQIDRSASSVSYSVEEEFFNREVQFVTAIGTTSEIEGSLSLDLSGTPAVTGGEIVVDISTLKSDSDRRDRAIQNDWLESATYPLATFTPKAIVGLSGPVAEGESASFQLVGDLTIREVTNEVTFDVIASVNGGILSGTATTLVMMADYGFEPPNILNTLIVTDGVSLTIELVASQS